MKHTLDIVTYNVKGFKPRNYNYLDEIFNKCDMLLLQETWLYNFQSNIVNSVLGNCLYHSTSAMDESNINKPGRPFGGCMIIWKKNLGISIKPVLINNPRICVVEVENHLHEKLLVINVYMPTNDNTLESFNLFGEVLNSISGLIETYDEHKVIIGGDFNVDFSKNSDNSKLLDDFLRFESYKCASSMLKNSIDFTFMSSNGTKSHIDHFLFSECLFNCFSNYICYVDGHNLSDHFPVNISFSFDTDIINDTKSSKNRCEYIDDWESVDKDNLQSYKLVLDTLLDEVKIPNDLKNCKNMACKMHSDVIMQILNKIIDIMHNASEITIPKKRISNVLGKPGWNKYVQPLKEKSIFWNEIWKEAGCPNQGELAMIRRNTGAKYHQAIKYIEKNKDFIIKCNVSRHLNKKKFNEFWSEIRKLKPKSYNCLSSIIDGEIGDGNIANLFGKK